MGWSFGWDTKKELVDYLRKNVNGKLVASSLRGTKMWSVWEKDGERFIVLDLIECDRRDKSYGYKSMTESWGPVYYNCPLSYLDMAPTACESWREKVRRHHARAKRKFSVGEEVSLIQGCKIPSATIVSTRPLLGRYDGETYRLKKSLIAQG